MTANDTGIARSDHDDPACAVAHGTAPPGTDPYGAGAGRDDSARAALVAVFASPVAGYLLKYGADLGYAAVLVEPDAARAADAASAGLRVSTSMPAGLGASAAVVVTDHHRDELGMVLRDALAAGSGWIGVMGNPRHPAPHVPALAALGVPEADVARVHRPIGLNIGSRTPAEIAIATLAGLIAERNARPGGFEFAARRRNPRRAA